MEMASGSVFQMKSKKEHSFGTMEQFSKISLITSGVLTSQMIMDLEKTARRCTRILVGMTFLAITGYRMCANLQPLTNKTPNLRRQMNLKRKQMMTKQSMTKSTVSIKLESLRLQHEKTASAEMAIYHLSTVQRRCKNSKTSS